MIVSITNWRNGVTTWCHIFVFKTRLMTNSLPMTVWKFLQIVLRHWTCRNLSIIFWFFAIFACSCRMWKKCLLIIGSGWVESWALLWPHLGLIQQQVIQPESSFHALIKCSVSASSCLWALLYFCATLYDFNERRNFSPCFGPPLSFPLMPLLGKHPHPFDISTDNVLIHQERRTAPFLRRIAGSGKGLCWT